ncbi:hypothetical protein HNW13_017520 [Shewanella sp. BF02_Schw]|uniref:hypothetical protein n=1 Tax=Shewanella sp. BF02_Schw TaxID=394908 RepID=UPI0017863744|nr:hypothetical protein [Shewanella sp. BF02_Schw]MBO1897539.1 hypothetical protein [Shewanella sp. BF02_Schw]
MTFTQRFNAFILLLVSYFSISDVISFYNAPSADFAYHLLYLLPVYFGLLTVTSKNLNSIVWRNKLLGLMLIALAVNHPYIANLLTLLSQLEISTTLLTYILAIPLIFALLPKNRTEPIQRLMPE